MTRLLQRGSGILVDWLAHSNRRQVNASAGRSIDVIGDMPAQRLDHPTYLRRGMTIDGMAMPAGPTGLAAAQFMTRH